VKRAFFPVENNETLVHVSTAGFDENVCFVVEFIALPVGWSGMSVAVTFVEVTSTAEIHDLADESARPSQ
jgi:hypothetical protein